MRNQADFGRRFTAIAASVIAAGAITQGASSHRADAAGTTPAARVAPHAKTVQNSHEAVAVLAGGCFWGMEEVFSALRGVKDVTSGYSGGNAKTAHYELVELGNTGHAESVRITYDPTIISYERLLRVYFTVAHDPTQVDKQEPDHGPQYRSEIFYTTDAQRETAMRLITQYNQTRTLGGLIATKVEKLNAFYAAEEYHQDFAAHNPNNPYIVAIDNPRMEHLRKAFPDLVVTKR